MDIWPGKPVVWMSAPVLLSERARVAGGEKISASLLCQFAQRQTQNLCRSEGMRKCSLMEWEGDEVDRAGEVKVRGSIVEV